MSSKSIEDFLAFLRDAEQQYNKKSFYEHDKMLSDDKLEKAIKAVSAMDTKSGASQSVYVIEVKAPRKIFLPRPATC